MRVLLDTHALLWWWLEESSLSARSKGIIADRANQVLVSAASAWEISTKARLGRLRRGPELAAGFSDYLLVDGFHGLPITPEHGVRAGLLPEPVRDPFDRMLIAQSQMESVALISNEISFDLYGIERIWS